MLRIVDQRHSAIGRLRRSGSILQYWKWMHLRIKTSGSWLSSISHSTVAATMMCKLTRAYNSGIVRLNLTFVPKRTKIVANWYFGASFWVCSAFGARVYHVREKLTFWFLQIHKLDRTRHTLTLNPSGQVVKRTGHVDVSQTHSYCGQHSPGFDIVNTSPCWHIGFITGGHVDRMHLQEKEATCTGKKQLKTRFNNMFYAELREPFSGNTGSWMTW